MLLKRVVSIFGLLALISPAYAGDYDQAANSGFRGNLHIGDVVYFDRVAGRNVSVPFLNLGGKFAQDSDMSPWGWQVDGDWSHTNLDWVRPRVSGADGNLNVVDTAAHATYHMDANSKLGLFAGYSLLDISLKDTVTGGFIDMGISSGALGVEGLTAISDKTWVEGRVALIDPFYVSATISDGITTESAHKSDILGKIVGGMVSARLSHALTQNTSVRADASYAVLGKVEGESLGLGNVSVTANYVFDEMPVALSGTLGYSRTELAGESSDAMILGTKATWSFGSPAQGAGGQLFRSGVLGFAN